jgi:eukaryotic-like serine/threonine-protein kinase
VTEQLEPSSNLTVASVDAATAPDPADQLIGQVIGGRYKVTRILGRGGMGVVYAGEHRELELQVAIKVLPTSFARDVETLKRFEREARTASRVRHPNVVTVFDLGRLDTGEPYLVMELLVGADLSEMVPEGTILALKDIVELLEPLGVALDVLHQQGVVHRDIKPSNIFFARDKRGVETMKLVDFGLAALHSHDSDARLTRVGQVVGTAIYMAPEAARGDLAGPAGDIYALGVLAFELLTGRPPFDGMPMTVILDKVSNVAPTLAQISGRPFDPRLEKVLASALARSPDQRPPTASAVVAAMRAVLDSGGAVRSDPPPPMPGSQRPPPPPRVLGAMETRDTMTDELTVVAPPTRVPAIAAVAAVLFVFVAVASGAVWYGGQTTPSPVPQPVLAAPEPAPAPAPVAPPAPDLPTAPLEVPVVAAVPEDTTPRGRPVRPRPSTARTPTAEATVVEATVAPVAQPAPDGTRSTDRTPALLRDASSAMLRGEIPHARELYREATLASPRNAAAWRGLGLACERLRLVPEARVAYTRYLELAPDARDASTVHERLDRLGS